MRPNVFSANNCILRHALPFLFLVQPCKSKSKSKSILSSSSSFPSSIPPILLRRSTTTTITDDGLSPLPKQHATIFTATSPRKFSARATGEVNDAGSIDSPLMQSMEKKIKEHLNAESVTVKDAYGDGRHVSIDVVSTAFEGQSAVNRQRMVYEAISEELQRTVHAVDQMTTRTPAEAAKS